MNLMNDSRDQHAHASDESLLRIIDDEPIEQKERLLAHVTGCAECASRLDAMRRSSSALTELMRATEPPAMSDLERERQRKAIASRLARSSRSRQWRRIAVAAASMFVVAGVAAATPIRAWLAARHQSDSARNGSPGLATRAVGATAPLPSSTVSFVTTGDTLLVDIAHAQPSGVLELRPGRLTSTSATIVGGRNEWLTVMPGALLIHNGAAATATYSVELGDNVRTVRVRVNGRVIGRWSAAEVPLRLNLEL